MAIKFGTDGWRAIISDEFTFDNVIIVASAIAQYLKNHKLDKKELIIGYDSRFLSEQFAEEVGKVMTASGINCFITERDTPTPVVAFEVKDRGAAGAVMITASHNPANYSGIKFIPHYAGPASDEITKEIEEYILKSQIPNPKSQTNPKSQIQNPKLGKMERFEPRERYFKALELLVDAEIIRKAKLKVVVDPMYGSGRGYLDKLLQRFGCITEEIHEQRDVLFGGRSPEPVEENLEELKKKIIETGSNLGLALDGDADRFGVIDERGRFYSANEIITLLTQYLIEKKGLTGAVVRSVATTHAIDRVAKLHGRKVYETPVGFKYIAELMMKKDILIGGEESGGLSIKGHIPEKDGILANLLVVEMVARSGKPLSLMFEDLRKMIGTYFSERINLKLDDIEKKRFIESLIKLPPQNLDDSPLEEVKTIDGVKILFKDGSWFLARPSGTEPLVRVYFESESQDKIEKMKDFVVK